jgi:hypothetical protein
LKVFVYSTISLWVPPGKPTVAEVFACWARPDRGAGTAPSLSGCCTVLPARLAMP